ncbi:putative arginyl-tRNA:protein arginylyltransferase [Desulfocapsa sulfexigens DSM 10523]|uniref:Aspartate/glutamate leucyltransferase n=1 Tax=Desulfocapsa sulfexigens (strain DSM 10523 / SB164P1) TaxID=1167006 RepID=M1NGD9_DESSD|nr:arginyltransferase [Desulfocapsa sulfexigens]AGF78719.1 putative arginyl-tRNA:protein arginylyltransferase [Desulfocapsa sulfexigens DSM 10523]
MKMSLYDEQCARDFELMESRIDHFFAEMAVECPYHLPHDARFYQALFSPLSDRAMELFLASGYRRNGNCLYTMHCPDCSACVPIRLHPQEMKLNRNQRRVLKKNQDIEVEFAPITASEENIRLCEKFLRSRYPHKYNDGKSYYKGFFLNRIIPGMEFRFRLRGRLVGTGIVDVGQNWMNAVYFYFDPDEASRSLGTFNILSMIETCLKLDISYLYLGYYIEEVAAMNYKRRFDPHYLYLDDGWRKIDKLT